MSFLEDRGLHPTGFVVSPGQEKERFTGLGSPVFYLDEVSESEQERVLLLAVADKTAKEGLDKAGCGYVEVPNYCFPFIKTYVNLLCE